MYRGRRGDRIACGNIERRVCSGDVYDGSESSKGLLVLVDSWMVEARLGEIVGPGDFGSNSHLSFLKLKRFLPSKVDEDILESLP
jgi:hypothetical protein